MTRRLLAPLVVLALVSVSCTAHQAAVISGDTLDILGDQFIAAAPIIKKAHADGHISQEQYEKWVSFTVKFKATYHLAVQLWIAASESQDADMVQRVSNIIATLGQELNQFIKEVSH